MAKLHVSVIPYSESENVMEFLVKKFSKLPSRIIREPDNLDAVFYEIDFGKNCGNIPGIFKEVIEKKLLSPPCATIIGDALYGLYRADVVDDAKSLEEFIKETKEA